MCIRDRLYGADGSLLQRKYLKNNIIITKTDYLRGVEYKSDTLESVHHPDGRAIKSGSDWIYEYWIKDHLGNVRVTYRDKNGDNIIDFSDQGSTSVHNYYTFGMEWINLADTLQPRNLYRYNGKEMIEEMDLNLAGYGARMMDPILGRFINVDPLADQFPGYSPYNYVLNNPIKLIDPDGRAPSDYDNEYVIDKNTGKTVEVSKAGGNEVDIIHSGTINDDGSIVVDPTQTQVVQVETISNPNIEYGGYRAPGLNIVPGANPAIPTTSSPIDAIPLIASNGGCLLYTSDAADERSSVDLGGRRIIKKKKK